MEKLPPPSQHFAMRPWTTGPVATTDRQHRDATWRKQSGITPECLYPYHADVPVEARLLKRTEEVGEVAEALAGPVKTHSPSWQM